MKYLFDQNRWNEIWQTISYNKSRSILTAFGVFWGMLMLVIMLGVGKAVENTMMSNIEGVATNSCFISSSQTSEPYKGFKEGRYWSIINEDIQIIKERVKGIDQISPVLFGNRNTNNIAYGNKTGTFSVKGHLPNYDLIEKNQLLYGRFLNDIDITEKRKVCVIGKRIYEVLFEKGSNPLGKEIKINGIYFQVIGVATGNKNINIGGSSEESAVLPFSTMQEVFRMGNTVHFITATAKAGVSVSVIENEIKDILKNQHYIAPNDVSAIWSMNIEDLFKMFFYLNIGISALIWIVGLGTLCSGGIGVSNIMLITVHERTKEIGIRRALGASPSNIVSQILMESIILTLIAGIIGLVLGVGIMQVINIIIQFQEGITPPQISFKTAVTSLFILMLIGIGAGLIPARRAIKIQAIEAIREE